MQEFIVFILEDIIACLLSKRFPFAVYYRIVENEILVYAVLDCRRDPAWIRKRLEH